MKRTIFQELLSWARENAGLVTLLLIFLLHRVQKRYLRKLVSPLLMRVCSELSLLVSYLFTTKRYDLKYISSLANPSDETYSRIRYEGVDFFIVNSAALVTKLISVLQYFENDSFVSRTLAFAHTIVAVTKRRVSADCDISNGTGNDCNNFSKRTENDSNKMDDKLDPSWGLNTCDDHQFTNEYVKECILSNKYCIKETIVLLEAKSNRKEKIDIKEYCYRHAVNVIGVCVFGKTINQLTNSRCSFYEHCDRLYEMWTRHETRNEGHKYLYQLLTKVAGTGSEAQPTFLAARYFTEMAVKLEQDERDAGVVHQKCLARVLIQSLQRQKNFSLELTSSLLIAVAMNVLELTAGIMSLLLHEMSANLELQQKIRECDQVQFDLKGLPSFQFENVRQWGAIGALIRKTCKKYPIEAVTRLTCKRCCCIPESRVRVNPGCVVLIPAHVLQIDNDNDDDDDDDDDNDNVENDNVENDDVDVYRDSTDSIDPTHAMRAINEECSFISDPQIRRIFVSVYKFVDICLKTSLTSLIQEYEFEGLESHLNYSEARTSCKFSELPKTLFLKAAKVEKRGKVVILEESLKAFYASKDVPFLLKIGL